MSVQKPGEGSPKYKGSNTFSTSSKNDIAQNHRFKDQTGDSPLINEIPRVQKSITNLADHSFTDQTNNQGKGIGAFFASIIEWFKSLFFTKPPTPFLPQTSVQQPPVTPQKKDTVSQKTQRSSNSTGSSSGEQNIFDDIPTAPSTSEQKTANQVKDWILQTIDTDNLSKENAKTGFDRLRKSPQFKNMQISYQDVKVLAEAIAPGITKESFQADLKRDVTSALDNLTVEPRSLSESLKILQQIAKFKKDAEDLQRAGKDIPEIESFVNEKINTLDQIRTDVITNTQNKLKQFETDALAKRDKLNPKLNKLMNELSLSEKNESGNEKTYAQKLSELKQTVQTIGKQLDSKEESSKKLEEQRRSTETELKNKTLEKERIKKDIEELDQKIKNLENSKKNMGDLKETDSKKLETMIKQSTTTLELARQDSENIKAAKETYESVDKTLSEHRKELADTGFTERKKRASLAKDIEKLEQQEAELFTGNPEIWEKKIELNNKKLAKVEEQINVQNAKLSQLSKIKNLLDYTSTSAELKKLNDEQVALKAEIISLTNDVEKIQQAKKKSGLKIETTEERFKRIQDELTKYQNDLKKLNEFKAIENQIVSFNNEKGKKTTEFNRINNETTKLETELHQIETDQRALLQRSSTEKMSEEDYKSYKSQLQTITDETKKIVQENVSLTARVMNKAISTYDPATLPERYLKSYINTPSNRIQELTDDVKKFIKDEFDVDDIDPSLELNKIKNGM